MNRKFLYAIATLIGTIVGAGIFGIPYGVVQSGFWIGLFYILVLGVVSLLLHLLLGEVVCRTQEKHRLVGYAEKYLGKKGKISVTISDVFGIYGALLAYLILVGKFSSVIFSSLFGDSLLVYSLVFFGLFAIFIFFDLKLVAPGEFLMSLFLLAVIGVIIFVGFPYIDFINFSNLKINDVFLVYGVILFAMAGGTAVPEIKEILKKNSHQYKKAIIYGTLIPLILYLVFTFVVIGVTGTRTTQEAMDGLVNAVGGRVIMLGAIFGLLAVITSFLVLGLYLKKMFWYDYKLNRHLAWFLVCIIPLILFVFGLRSFITVIGIVGSFSIGFSGIIIGLLYKRAKTKGDREPEYSLKVPELVRYILMGIFTLGIVYQIIYLIK